MGRFFGMMGVGCILEDLFEKMLSMKVQGWWGWLWTMMWIVGWGTGSLTLGLGQAFWGAQ
jgi:hypothetical protein